MTTEISNDTTVVTLPAGHPFVKATSAGLGFTDLGYMAWLMKRGNDVDRAYEAAYISFTCPGPRSKDHSKLAAAKLREIESAGGYAILPIWPNYNLVCDGVVYQP